MKETSAFPRIFPFALFMVFIGIGEALRGLESAEFISLDKSVHYSLYPIRTIAVLLALIYFWRRYSEISLSDFGHIRNTLLSLGTGLLVFVLWVNMDFPFAIIG